jgi:hypothetical protein
MTSARELVAARVTAPDLMNERRESVMAGDATESARWPGYTPANSLRRFGVIAPIQKLATKVPSATAGQSRKLNSSEARQRDAGGG